MNCIWYIVFHLLLLAQPIWMCETGDVRLIAGRTALPLEGRVEICRSDMWGTVCSNNWDDLDATVVCRQLGFSGEGSIALDSGYVSTNFGRGRGNIFLDLVNCIGNETMLRECPSSTQITCDHSSDAGVRCSHTGSPVLIFNGRVYPNNSIIPLQEIGYEPPTFNASVYCYTNHPSCCNQFVSFWYLPLGIDLDLQVSYEHFWSSFGAINLYRPPSSYTSGVFACQVVDQFLFVGIYQQGIVIGRPSILSFTYERSSRTLICQSTGGPATTVLWRKNGTLLNVDGVNYKQVQVVLNTGLATYENRLNLRLTPANITYGLYSCEVRNVKGSSSASLEVSACNNGDALFAQDTGKISQICQNGVYYYVTDTPNVPRETQPNNEMSSTFFNTNEQQTTEMSNDHTTQMSSEHTTEMSSKRTTEMSSVLIENNTPCPMEESNNQQVEGRGSSNLLVIILGALVGAMAVIVIVLFVAVVVILLKKKESENIPQISNITYENTRPEQNDDCSHEFQNELYVDKEVDSSSMQYNYMYIAAKNGDNRNSNTIEETIYDVLKESANPNIYEEPK